MKQLQILAITGAILAIGHAGAAEQLDQVVTDVIEAPGMTAAQIGDRGLQCLKASSGNVADRVDPARDGDNAYAIVITSLKRMTVTDQVRSRMTVISKDGRFKVAHTDIERYIDFGAGTWKPVQKYMGSGFEAVKGALQDRASAVAACIATPAPTPGGDNW